jgi:nitric oxide reductase activation protein
MSKGKVMKDWFGRRAEDAYTYRDDSKRLFSWDSGRKHMSSFFINDGTSLQSSAKMIGSMFRVINVPKDIKYSAGEHTSENAVQIPLSLLKDEDGKYSDHDLEKLDAFYGKSIQNAALATMQTKYEYGKTLNALNADKKNFKLKDYLFSILNTERVDKKLADRLPGYMKFVQKYKDYAYDKNYEPIDESEPAQKRLLDLVTRMLRYPGNITEEEMAEFEKPMKQIERLIKKFGGMPATSDECTSMASSLANIVYKHVEEPPKPESSPGDGDDDEDESEGDDESPSGGAGESPESEDESDSDDKEDEESESSPKTSSSPEMSKSDLDDFAREMSRSIMAEEGDGSDEEQEALAEFEESMEEADHAPRGDYDDDATDGGIGMHSVYFTKAGSNKTAYMSALKKIDTTKASVLRKLFARKSKDYQFSMKSMRSGRLDTNKIAEAIQGVPTIYERYGHVKTDKICVGVLIDESGSMSGSSIQKAREAAIFINEVFKKSPDVQLFVYGHTADITTWDSTDITIYREPGYYADPYALGTVTARSQNRDGTAILATAKRIRKFTPDQGILFVISDGAPCASNYSGSQGIADTREKVTKAQMLGFQVIQIAIEAHVPSERMFDYFVKMTDIKNLPKDLVSYMSRKVDKLVRERVSL